MNKLLLGLIALLVIIALPLIGAYNNLVTKSQLVNTQWAQVQTQYQRRFDLIPNLTQSVEGVMKQERAVFGDLAAARANYAGAKTPESQVQAAGQVESALSRLLVVMENYPTLKSNESVNRLMDELAGTENRIAVERSRYNDTVTDYNLTVSRFPGSIIARLFGFSPKPLFTTTPGADVVPQVNLNP
jgi:LemA protein